MKKAIQFLVASGVVLSGVFLSSCNKNNDQVQVPVAGLMAFNLAPDVSAMGITLSGNNLTQSPLGYTNYTGGYLSVYTGNREAESYDFTQNRSLARTSNTYENGKYYSLFVLGANDTYRNVIVHDNFDSLSATAGKAYVRYINAIPDSAHPQVELTAGGSSVISVNAPYASVSEFTEVNPGDVTVSVNSESGINMSRTISLAQNKAYTVLLIGKPGATDTTRQVKIRFVENGQLTE